MERKGRFQIKIFFEKHNIRRYSFDQSPTWLNFYETFKQLFKMEFRQQNTYKFEYQDNEGDRVVVDSEVEWQEMLYLFKNDPIIKLFVTEEKSQCKLPTQWNVLPNMNDLQTVINDTLATFEGSHNELLGNSIGLSINELLKNLTMNQEEEKKEIEKKVKEEKQALEEAENKAREEAEKQAREEAENKAREEAEKQAREEAEKKARVKAEELARKAEEKKSRLAALKKMRQTKKKARLETEKKARLEAEKKARLLTKARLETEKKECEEAENKAREEAEAKAREEAEAKAREEVENKAQEQLLENIAVEAEEWRVQETDRIAREQAEEKALEALEEMGRKICEEEERARRIVQSTPPETSSSQTIVQRFTPQLHILFELGFQDISRNLKLLVTFNGRVEDVIETLLNDSL